MSTRAGWTERNGRGIAEVDRGADEPALIGLRDALLRSLDRHVASNTAVKRAFANLARELEIAALDAALNGPQPGGIRPINRFG